MHGSKHQRLHLRGIKKCRWEEFAEPMKLYEAILCMNLASLCVLHFSIHMSSMNVCIRALKPVSLKVHDLKSTLSELRDPGAFEQHLRCIRQAQGLSKAV